MCGILGITGKREAAVREAAALFRYRGPDAFGLYADDAVTLGQNRLAIIDLDPRSDQPLFDETGEYGINFNGELYNYRELREELKGLGYSFRTEGDAEVLLAAYRAWGVGMFPRLYGMYAIAFYDRSAGKILLAADHAAIKPLYYFIENGALGFASELKGAHSLASAAGVELALDQRALEEYWALGYVPAPRTLYTQIHRLRRRTWLEYDLASRAVRTGEYTMPAGAATDAAGLSDIVRAAVKRHLIADVPVGVFFSGGTDSSLIVSMLHDLGVELETFSMRVEGRSGDGPYFTQIAEHLGIKAHVYDFGVPEFDEAYADLLPLIDDPIADNSLFPTYIISKRAAKRVKVVLSGEGGDEYFCGYPRSVALAAFAKRGAPFDERVGFLDLLCVCTPNFKGKSALFARIFASAGKPLAYYLLTMSPARSRLPLSLWRAGKRALAERAHDALDLDPGLYLESDLLRKTDEATMYCSIEGRVPLLDPAVIAAARATPQQPTAQTLKPLLKAVLARFLPSELVYRAKSGFGLDPQQLLGKSAHFNTDLETAVAFLREKALLPSHIRSARDLKTQPALALQTVMLCAAFRNAEAGWAEATRS